MAFHNTKLFLASVSAVAIASGASAQIADPAAAPANQAQAADSTGVADQAAGQTDDIIVTARRKNETLQDVPQTITAVSSKTVEKLNLLKFEDVASVVPGLNLSSSGGASASASIRGISIDTFSGASPTVDLYQNDVPIDAGTLFTTIYDVGQIEVLRGPQGTVRGRTAPSGAITLSTRRADLREVGGYASMTGTHRGTINVQGAVNVPIVADRLAIRVAGVADQNEVDFVRSASTGVRPRRETYSGRVSVAARPIDALDIQASYQRIDDNTRRFRQVAGNGAAGGMGLPAAGYNGPVITAADRLGVQDAPTTFNRTADILTGQASLAVLGQRLTYVGGYINGKLGSRTELDYGNAVPGRSFYQTLAVDSEQTTHEIRLASDTPGALIDYVGGFFYSDSKSRSQVSQPAAFLAGAFGSPANVPPTTGVYDGRYALPVMTDIPGKTTERSFFGTVTLHATPRTELSVGGRYIISKVNSVSSFSLGAGLVAVPLPVPCGLLGATSTYAGFCDFVVPASNGPISTTVNKRRSTPFVYNVSLSHRFSDSLRAYATVGSSWRQGPTDIGLVDTSNDPVLAGYRDLRPEKSTSYEVGIKTSAFDNRLRFDVAVFHQHFDGLIVRLQEAPYVTSNGAQQRVADYAFTANADANVTGFDANATFQAMRNWSIGATVTYADGKIANDLVPCRDGNFDGIPDNITPTLAAFTAAGKKVALCKSNGSTSRDPLWSASGQSELFVPVGASEAYLRALANYRPRNSRQDVNFTVNSYTLVNLYAGLRSPDGAWDVGLFAKNAFNNGTQLSRAAQQVEAAAGIDQFFGPSGYFATSYTPPREFGLNVRYSFGSR